MSIQQNIYTNWIHAMNFETPNDLIKCDKQLLKIDDQLPRFHYHLGWCYSLLFQYDKAIPEFKKALEIYNKWGVKPMWIYNYTILGNAYHETKQYRKEKKLYKKAEHDFPNDELLIYRQAVLDLSEGKIKDADEYIEKYKSVRKEQAATDAVITTNLASLYWQGEVLDKAEEYYRKALSLEPDNPARMNILGWFLIDTDRNIKEGLEVNDKALEFSPDNHYYLDCKGWGLYKQGKYEEALKILEKSWELRPVYRHEVYLHLEAAKKAVANQKNN